MKTANELATLLLEGKLDGLLARAHTLRWAVLLGQVNSCGGFESAGHELGRQRAVFRQLYQDAHATRDV